MLGQYNIAIGSNATILNNNVTNSIVIGSGARSTQTGAIILGGTGINVGVGLSAPSYKLDVAGTGAFYGLRVSSGAVNNYILTSDATGNATWRAATTTAWGLTGNAGTNPTTQFIGTTDNQDVVFKRNNIESFRLSGASGTFTSIRDITVNGINI